MEFLDFLTDDLDKGFPEAMADDPRYGFYNLINDEIFMQTNSLIRIGELC